jgi:hypothetical protein
MLEIDVKKRITAAQVLEHPWIQQKKVVCTYSWSIWCYLISTPGSLIHIVILVGFLEASGSRAAQSVSGKLVVPMSALISSNAILGQVTLPPRC